MTSGGSVSLVIGSLTTNKTPVHADGRRCRCCRMPGPRIRPKRRIH
jgi:hypothetical protein